ncbi:MAG: hypothetical protein U0893_02420 [Chloroflexota bacterium]
MTVQTPTAEPSVRPASRPWSPADDAEAPRGATTRRAAVSAKPGQRRLSPRMRQWLVAAHVLVGVGWFGIVAAKLVLEVVALSSADRGVERAGLLFASALDRAVFPPFALATLVTGIVLSLATAWGLFRYWWIVVKLVLTVAVIATGVGFVGAWTASALAATSLDANANAASAWLIGAAAVHLLMLGAATVISVLKPWGRIGQAAGRAAR